MDSKDSLNIFPQKITINELLQLIEEKVKECNCGLKEAFEMLIKEKLKENN